MDRKCCNDFKPYPQGRGNTAMRAIKRHYHWVIALIIFVEMIIYGGFLNTGSVFTVPITEELHLSRGGYSLTLIPRGIVGFFSTLITGFLFHRFGYRKCAIVSLLSFAGGLFLLASARSAYPTALWGFLMVSVPQPVLFVL